jgi:hypothetical protein
VFEGVNSDEFTPKLQKKKSSIENNDGKEKKVEIAKRKRLEKGRKIKA